MDWCTDGLSGWSPQTAVPLQPLGHPLPGSCTPAGPRLTLHCRPRQRQAELRYDLPRHATFWAMPARRPARRRRPRCCALLLWMSVPLPPPMRRTVLALPGPSAACSHSHPVRVTAVSKGLSQHLSLYSNSRSRSTAGLGSCALRHWLSWEAGMVRRGQRPHVSGFRRGVTRMREPAQHIYREVALK